MSAVLAAVRAPDGHAPAERISLAYGLDSHKNEKRTQPGPESRGLPALNPKRVALLRVANAQVLGFTEPPG